MKLLKKVRERRLLTWLMGAVILFIVIAVLAPQQLPIVVYKLSLVLLAAVIGYHLDRALFPYASPGGYLYYDWKEKGSDYYVNQYTKDGNDEIPIKLCAEYPVLDEYRTIFAIVLIRRALIVTAVILGVTLGL